MLAGTVSGAGSTRAMALSAFESCRVHGACCIATGSSLIINYVFRNNLHVWYRNMR